MVTAIPSEGGNLRHLSSATQAVNGGLEYTLRSRTSGLEEPAVVTVRNRTALIALCIAFGCGACGGSPSAPSSSEVTWMPLTDLSPLAGTTWTGVGTASDDSTSYTYTSTLFFSTIGQLNGVNVQQGGATLIPDPDALFLQFWGTANMFDLHRGCAIILPPGSIGGATPVRWTTLEESSDGKRIRLAVTGWFGVRKDGWFTWTKTS